MRFLRALIDLTNRLLIEDWARRTNVRMRREADERLRAALDKFITAGEEYLDQWVDAYDRARDRQAASGQDAA